MANKITCTCGHSWSTADSSAKDKYVCHICGKDTRSDVSKAQVGDEVPAQKITPEMIKGWNEYRNYLDEQGLFGDPRLNTGFGKKTFVDWATKNPNYGVNWETLPIIGEELAAHKQKVKEAVGRGKVSLSTPISEFNATDVTNAKSKNPWWPGTEFTSQEFADYVEKVKDSSGKVIKEKNYGVLPSTETYDKNRLNVDKKDIPINIVKSIAKQKNGGWLDRYDEGGEYLGTTNKGFDYNGAWGGPSMAMGGSLPGAVGFTYARTQGAAPANGKYTKKTLASAQVGRAVSDNTRVKPIVTEKPMNRETVKSTNKSYRMSPQEALLNKLKGKKLKESQDRLDKTAEKITAVGSLSPNPLISIPSGIANFTLGVTGAPTPGDAGLDYMGLFGSAATPEYAKNFSKVAKRVPFFKGLGLFDAASDVFEFTPSEDLPKKQNGGEMKFYQEGLDWKPRNISQDGTYVKKPRTDMLTMDEYRLKQALAKQPVIQSPKGKQLTKEQILAKNQQYAEAQGKRFDPNSGAVSNFLSPSTARTFERGSENIVEPMIDIEMAMSAAPLIGQGLKSAGKFVTEETALKNAYKLNPFALKENPETYLYRARPVGQDVNMNMAAQLKAKEAAGEPLAWWQKNLLNEQVNPQMVAREKYYGQWFEKDPSRLDFYVNPGTRNFSENDAIEILRTRLPKSEADKLNVSQFSDAKILSASPKTEYILPKDMIESAERFPEGSLQNLIEQHNKFNTPNWLKGYKEVPKKKEGGGVIKDDMGQWAHPGEVTEIGSPYITMEGVPYPVLGVSDTGDTKMMHPGKDYKFKGKKVTEYPVSKKWLEKYK